MNYTLKDVFRFYFEKNNCRLSRITVWDKVKMLLGVGSRLKEISFYGNTPKIGDKIGYIMEYKFDKDKKGYMDISRGRADIKKFLYSEIDQYCENYELMSIHEKPTTIEKEIDSGVVRTIEKGMQIKKTRKARG